jgi:hypothetical protein
VEKGWDAGDLIREGGNARVFITENTIAVERAQAEFERSAAKVNIRALPVEQERHCGPEIGL